MEVVRQSAHLLKQCRLIAAEFVRIELELAATFCEVALTSAGDQEKGQRNLEFARRAYEAAMRFSREAHIDGEVFQRKVALSRLDELFAEVEASLRD